MCLWTMAVSSAAAFAILGSSFASSVVTEEAEELDELAMFFLDVWL